MKKILIITAGFFPGINYGGPPVSIDNFCTLFDEYQTYIVTTDHDHKSRIRYKNIKRGWNDRGNCKVLYLPDRQYNYTGFIQICRKISPDWIYLQGLFQPCIIPCLFMAKREGRRTILAVRGELCKGAFQKKMKKIPYIIFLKLFHLLDGICFQSTSREETRAIKHWLRIADRHIHYIPNIPVMPEAVRESPGVKQPDKAKFVFISRIVPKKNLIYALKRLMSMDGAVVFDIYGLIEDKDYWNSCENIIKRLPENVSVRYRGPIGHEQVLDVFCRYDAFLFPTYSENYGHVIVESLLAGCPVIMSDRTPWRDLAKEHAGWDLDLSRKDQYEDAVRQIVAAGEADMRCMRAAAKKYICNRLNTQKIKDAYKRVFESG